MILGVYFLTMFLNHLTKFFKLLKISMKNKVTVKAKTLVTKLYGKNEF
jgi:hypothetical protein